MKWRRRSESAQSLQRTILKRRIKWIEGSPLPSPQQLRYLLALAGSRHFGRATAHCAVTQSTLSVAAGAGAAAEHLPPRSRCGQAGGVHVGGANLSPLFPCLLRREPPCDARPTLRCRCHASTSAVKHLTLTDPPIQTLTAQRADFNFHHIQPADVPGCKWNSRRWRGCSTLRVPGMFRRAPWRCGSKDCPSRAGSGPHPGSG
jgi:hypothetical protein